MVRIVFDTETYSARADAGRWVTERSQARPRPETPDQSHFEVRCSELMRRNVPDAPRMTTDSL